MIILAARKNWEAHSFVSSSLEFQPDDGASAPRNPDGGRTSLKENRKTRTLPGGTLRVTEPPTAHYKQNIFEGKTVTERRVIGRNEIRTGRIE